MSKRLQVVMSDAEYVELREAAATRRLTVSEWVREVLREARQAADPPMTRDEMRDLRGSGWEGDLTAMRGAELPSDLG